uniref:Putative secreted protein n=1 Tax=Anopheles darlingi TaxID=43151 RepID=A0A2M4DGZ3_ANODA
MLLLLLLMRLLLLLLLLHSSNIVGRTTVPNPFLAFARLSTDASQQWFQLFVRHVIIERIDRTDDFVRKTGR